MKILKNLLIILSCICLTGCGDTESESNFQNENQVTTTTTTTTITTTSTTKEATTTTTTTVTTKPVEDIETINSKTFLTSTFAVSIPMSWEFSKPVTLNLGYPTTIHSYTNGDFSFMIEECAVGTSMSDEEIFNERVNQFWDEETCENVEIYSIGDMKYAYTIYSNDANFHIYTFVHNGYLYQFDVSYLNLIPDGEIIVEDMFNSIAFDVENIQMTHIPSFNNLTSDEQQYLIKSIMFYNGKFSHPKSISINQCCTYVQNGEEIILQDLTYKSSSNEMTTNTFLYNNSKKAITILNQSYADVVNSTGDSVVTYDAELLNQVLQDYLEQS